MKLCMIGMRGHSCYVFESLNEIAGIDLAAVSAGCPEDSPAPLLENAAKCGFAPCVYDDWREMLDREKPDVLSIDGKYDLHAEMCVEAARRNIHIFCEKPIALTLESLDAIEAALETSSSKLVSMVGLRYDLAMYHAHRLVSSGAIGKVKLIYAQKSYRLGTRPDFYKKRETYGGTIPWVGSHALDWIMWFADSGFASVAATQTSEDNFGNGSMEIAAQAIFTMKSGVLAEASIEYLRPAAAPSHGDDRVRVAGTSGVIEVRDGHIILIDAAGQRTIEPDAPDRKIFSDFVFALEGKRECLVDNRQSLDLTRACLLTRQAADDGTIIRF